MTAPNDIDDTIQAMRDVSGALTKANEQLLKARDLMRRSGLANTFANPRVHRDPTLPDIGSIVQQFENLMREHAALAYLLGQVDVKLRRLRGIERLGGAT